MQFSHCSGYLICLVVFELSKISLKFYWRPLKFPKNKVGDVKKQKKIYKK